MDMIKSQLNWIEMIGIKDLAFVNNFELKQKLQ